MKNYVIKVLTNKDYKEIEKALDDLLVDDVDLLEVYEEE